MTSWQGRTIAELAVIIQSLGNELISDPSIVANKLRQIDFTIDKQKRH